VFNTDAIPFISIEVFALSICFSPYLGHFSCVSIENRLRGPITHYTKRWQDEVNVSLRPIMSSFLIMGSNKELGIGDETI
jgi:hypothetical protein